MLWEYTKAQRSMNINVCLNALDLIGIVAEDYPQVSFYFTSAFMDANMQLTMVNIGLTGQSL